MRLLHVNTSDTFNIFWTSDVHLRHKGPKGAPIPLYESRGYRNHLHMTDEIINTINATVKPNDYLVYLGDWCLNSSVEDFEIDLQRIYCQNILMLWGNHNSRVGSVYESVVKQFLEDKWKYGMEVYPVKYKNITYYGDYLELVVNGQYICCFHYPIDSFHKGGSGGWMLHGHCHGNYKPTLENCLDSKRLDVSWDCFKKPLSFNEIKTIMDKKKSATVDHH